MEGILTLYKNTSPYYIVLMLAALSPVFSVILPWDFGEIHNDYQKLMTNNSLAIIAVTIFSVFFILRTPLQASFAAQNMSTADKILGIIFCALLGYSFVFVSVNRLSALINGYAIVVQCLLFFILYHHGKQIESKYWQRFWVVLGFSVIGYSLLWAADYTIYPPGNEDWISRIPGVTNVRWTGFYWLAIVSAGFVFVGNNRAKSNILSLIFGGFGLTMLFWTGTRGGLIAIIAGLLISLILVRNYRKFILGYLIGSLALAVSINTLLPIPHPQYGIERIFGKISNYEDSDKLGSGRITLWTESLKLIAERPVAGHGIDQFQFMGPKLTRGFKGPHSFPIQILFSIGLLGSLLLLYAIGRFWFSHRLNLTQPHQLSSLFFASSGCAYLVYDNFLYYPFPITIFGLSLLMIFTHRQMS